MMRLLWKEWHERWPWLALFTLAVVVLAALGKGQPAFGSMMSSSQYMQIPLLLALLAGLGGYGSELQGERVTFLYSRAVGWGQVLLAKVGLGLVTTLLAVALGALACLVCFPPEYRPFMFPTGLALGALEAAGVFGGAYLIGLAFSMALPGLAGAILALCIWAGITFLIGSILGAPGLHITPAWMIFGILLGPGVAGVVLARFGLTLGRGARLRRFLLLALAPLLLGMVLDLIPPVHRLLDHTTEPTVSVTLSPSGRYALKVDAPGGRPRFTVITLATGHRALVPMNSVADPKELYGQYRWLPNDCLYFLLGQEFNADGVTHEDLLAYPTGGRVVVTLAPLPFPFARPPATPSPDGRRLLVNDATRLRVIDLTRSTTRVLVTLPHKSRRESVTITHAWWQNNTTIGYRDPQNDTRVLLPVGE